LIFEVKIDQNKCTFCKACIEICPSSKIEEAQGYAKVSTRRCVYCYHCVAICPEDAVSTIPEIKTDNAPQLKDSSLYLDFLKTRHTTRCFLSKTVEKEVLKDICSSLLFSPRKGNTKKLSFTILGEDGVRALKTGISAFFMRLLELTKNNIYRNLMLLTSKKDESFYYTKDFLNVLKEVTSSPKDKIFYNSPCVILIHGNKNTSFAAEDAQIAAYHLSLATHAAGLGSLITFLAAAGINKNFRLKNALGFNKNEKVFAAAAIGYPKYPFKKDVYREECDITFI
jgi:Pyruvate/2-oxoacid:ferredoxin oxidoreductase delta subunit/nitroreductase